jgi:hypothetical protein
VPGMTAEDLLRSAWSIVAVAGLVVLAITLGRDYGPWAAGTLLLVAGGAAAVPLWIRKLDNDAARREVKEAKGGREEFHGVPPAPGAAAEEGGGQSFQMPGG